MVLSTEHRYVFIQVPHTGSTAVARELCTHYQGVQVLHKHATYADLLQAADGNLNGYRIIAGIRNPLEMFHTKFAKRASNHGDMFTVKAEQLRKHRRGRKHLREFEYVQAHPDDFEGFFHRFAPRVYNDLAGGLPARIDYLLRHEQLAEDFHAMIKRLDLELVQPLPVHNPTDKATHDLSEVYPESIRKPAAACFGPYLEQWGYRLPDGWDAPPSSPVQRWLFRADRLARNAYYHWQARFRGGRQSLSL